MQVQAVDEMVDVEKGTPQIQKLKQKRKEGQQEQHHKRQVLKDVPNEILRITVDLEYLRSDHITKGILLRYLCRVKHLSHGVIPVIAERIDDLPLLITQEELITVVVIIYSCAVFLRAIACHSGKGCRVCRRLCYSITIITKLYGEGPKLLVFQ